MIVVDFVTVSALNCFTTFQRLPGLPELVCQFIWIMVVIFCLQFKFFIFSYRKKCPSTLTLLAGW